MSDVVLIAVNNDDIASANQAKFLLENHQLVDNVMMSNLNQRFQSGNVTHVVSTKRILWQDDLDRRWDDATKETVNEVIFPSRHAAVSGKPCLTLHPIGVPHHPLEKNHRLAAVLDMRLLQILVLDHGGDFFTRSGIHEQFLNFLTLP